MGFPRWSVAPLLLALVAAAPAQIVFGAWVNDGNGTVAGLFRVDAGGITRWRPGCPATTSLRCRRTARGWLSPRNTCANPLLTAAVSSRLMVPDLQQGTLRVLANFNPGVFPLGVAWSPDGGTLVFSLANQTVPGGSFMPGGDPDSAVLRTIDSANGGAPGTVAGGRSGISPAWWPPTRA